MEIWNEMPLPLLDPIRFRQGVHRLEGVSVPHEVATKITMGFRFLLSTETNNTIVLRDYVHFCNTIRWKIYFNVKVRPSYDHRYDLKSGESSTATKASVPIEAGLVEVRSRLMRMIEEAIKIDSQSHLGMRQARELLEYLKKNDLFVTSTNKNIGTAIVSRTWYIQACIKYLDNGSSIPKISVDKCHELMDYLHYHIEKVVLSITHPLT